MFVKKISVAVCALSLAVITGCDSDKDPVLPGGQQPLPGPVTALGKNQPCGVPLANDQALLHWVPPLPDTLDGPMPDPDDPNAFWGLRVGFESDDPLPDEVPIEVLDQDSCRVVATLTARKVETADGLAGLLVPAADFQAQLDTGTYIARLPDRFSGVGEVGGYVNVHSLQQRPTGCDGRLVLDEEVRGGTLGAKRQFFVTPGHPADLCVEIEQQSGPYVIREVVINEQRVFPPDEDAGSLPIYVVRYPAGSERYAINIDLAKGSARVKARVTERRATETRAAIDCGGRLKGFDDRPYVDQPRRSIKREGVWTECTAEYELDRRWSVTTLFNMRIRDKIRTRVSAAAYTNENGWFSATIPSRSIQAAGVSPDDELLGVESDCIYAGDCGVDRVGTHVQNPDHAWWLPINNVPDMAVSGLVARLITTEPMPEPPKFSLGNTTSISYGWSGGLWNWAGNDLPIVVHEPFDPLLEDGTDGVVWALGGQPTDYSKPNKPSKIRESACDGVIRGVCFPRKNQLFPIEDPHPSCEWSPSCPSSLDDPTARFRCEGTNVLSILLEKGYDIWIVDHVREDPTVLELATRAPALYQMVADYPVREWFGRTNRKLGVVGVSMGAVVARTGVRLWELQDELDRLSPESELQLARRDLIRDSAEDRVALYVSYEGPHRGSELPLSFQALVKDRNVRSRLNFSQLLSSKSAEQLTVPFVQPGFNTGCVAGDGKPDDCTLRPGDIPSGYQTEFEAALLAFQSIEVLDALDSLPPRPVLGENLPPMRRDGIPKRVPAITVSNGELQAGSRQPSGKFAELHLDTKALGVDIFWPDETVNLHDSPMPHGSTLSQICRLEELETSGGNWLGSGKLRTRVLRAPTFVTTGSSLHLDTVDNTASRVELPYRWHDALYQFETASHFNIDDRQCQFLVYHIDGQMRGDRDGFPACRPEATSCASGAVIPGAVLSEDHISAPNHGDWCDADDSDPRVFAPAVPGGLIKALPDLPAVVDP